MDAIIQELKAEFEDVMDFHAMDFDDKRNWGFFERANVVTIPSLVCVINGEPRSILVGLRPKAEVRAILQEWLVQYQGRK